MGGTFYFKPILTGIYHGKNHKSVPVFYLYTKHRKAYP